MADIPQIARPTQTQPGPFRAVGSRVLRLAGLRCRLLYPAAVVDGAAPAPYLAEGRQTSEPWPWIRRGGHEIRRYLIVFDPLTFVLAQ